jgi:hypothetical protein
MFFKIPVSLIVFESIAAVFGQGFADTYYTPIRLV